MTRAIRPLVIKGDHALVPLSQGEWAVIDLEDVDIVSKHNWTLKRTKSGKKYAYRSCIDGRGRNTTITLHRFIFSELGERLCDHRDGDGLNNRRRNLRPATKSQNGQNRGASARSTTRVKGVYAGYKPGWFRSYIRANGTQKYLGHFPSKQEAHECYRQAELKYFGQFARQL